ncbi:unnamed protein product, partial [Prorocentrum cordatum]
APPGRSGRLAPAEALGLLLAAPAGACPPGEAEAPRDLLCQLEGSRAGGGPAGEAALGPAEEIGAQELPPALRVRNTFLDAPLQRSPSLERFIEPRLCNSTPPTPQGRVGRPQILTALDEDPMPAYLINTPTESVLDGMFRSPKGESLTWPRPVSPMLQMGRLHQASPRLQPAVLSLSDAIGAVSGPPVAAAAPAAVPAAAPALWEIMGSGRSPGQDALPSRGSALHRYGACKPCAFIYREGCKGGSDCQFCHLCEPGERKARKKERLAMKRDSLGEARREEPSVRRGRLGGC